MTARTSASPGKVCVIAPIPPPYGGMSLQAETLVARLRQEGISVRVIPVNPDEPGILSWARDIPGLRTVIRELQFLSQIIRIEPDCEVIHHFSASGLYFFAYSAPLLLICPWLRKRMILNYRGGNAAEFLRNWAWFAVPLMRRATSICVPSQFLQQIFGEYKLTSTLLPNIAQTEMFSWKKRESFAPSLLVTRHLDPMYNIECLLRAFRIIKERFPEAKLCVAGDGSEAKRLQELVAKWKLDRVKFLGSIAHDELPALYASHDIYVNSSNVDNFPGALVEAASCGLPIVTTGAGGIPSMIKHRERGIVVGLNDDKALAAGVIEIIEHPEFGRSLARRARTWAEQFSWKEVLPRLVACYGSPSGAIETNVPEAEALIQ
jgi:glycosyltransferase involved in cell wall biosynthesis